MHISGAKEGDSRGGQAGQREKRRPLFSHTAELPPPMATDSRCLLRHFAPAGGSEGAGGGGAQPLADVHPAERTGSRLQITACALIGGFRDCRVANGLQQDLVRLR